MTKREQRRLEVTGEQKASRILENKKPGLPGYQQGNN